MSEVVYSEHAEQAELLRWSREAAVLAKYPEVEWLFAVPNGAKLPYTGTGRSRRCKQAGILKQEGLKAGVPDLVLPVARGQYHCLFIELKRNSSRARVSDDQAKWIWALRALGHKAVVRFGWESARNTIIDYLELNVDYMAMGKVDHVPASYDDFLNELKQERIHER